jgi:hypothetical protein
MNGDNSQAIVDDADGWITIYGELVRSTEEALRRAQGRGPVPESEIQLLHAHLSSFRDRLAFWRIRRGRDELLRRPAVGGWMVRSGASATTPGNGRPAVDVARSVIRSSGLP